MSSLCRNAALLGLIWLTAACHRYAPEQAPGSEGLAASKVLLYLRDGRRLQLANPTMTLDSVIGRDVRASQRRAVAVHDIAAVQPWESHPSGTLAVVATTFVIALMILSRFVPGT